MIEFTMPQRRAIYEDYKAGKQPVDLAMEYGVTRKQMTSLLYRLKYRYSYPLNEVTSELTKRTIAAMFENETFTLAQLCARFRVSEETIEEYIKDYGEDLHVKSQVYFSSKTESYWTENEELQGYQYHKKQPQSLYSC